MDGTRSNSLPVLLVWSLTLGWSNTLILLERFAVELERTDGLAVFVREPVAATAVLGTASGLVYWTFACRQLRHADLWRALPMIFGTVWLWLLSVTPAAGAWLGAHGVLLATMVYAREHHVRQRGAGAPRMARAPSAH